jgi:hypothetical protein
MPGPAAGWASSDRRSGAAVSALAARPGRSRPRAAAGSSQRLINPTGCRIPYLAAGSRQREPRAVLRWRAIYTCFTPDLHLALSAGERRPRALAWTAPGICAWFTPGLHLVYTWFTPGLHLVYTWITPGLHLVYTWFTPGSHLVYTWFTPDPRLAGSSGPNALLVPCWVNGWPLVLAVLCRPIPNGAEASRAPRHAQQPADRGGSAAAAVEKRTGIVLLWRLADRRAEGART